MHKTAIEDLFHIAIFLNMDVADLNVPEIQLDKINIRTEVYRSLSLGKEKQVFSLLPSDKSLFL
jgi:hypothetical protein